MNEQKTGTAEIGLFQFSQAAAAAAQIAFTVLLGIGGNRTLQLFAQLGVIMVQEFILFAQEVAAHVLQKLIGRINIDCFLQKALLV